MCIRDRVLGLALLSSPHMQRFECMFVCVFWVLSCCHTLHPTAGCNYHRDSAQKTKNKKPEKQEPTQNHCPFSVSLLFVKKRTEYWKSFFHRYFYISLSGNSTYASPQLPESCGIPGIWLCAVLCCVIFEFAGGLLLGMQGMRGHRKKWPWITREKTCNLPA